MNSQVTNHYNASSIYNKNGGRVLCLNINTYWKQNENPCDPQILVLSAINTLNDPYLHIVVNKHTPFSTFAVTQKKFNFTNKRELIYSYIRRFKSV